MTGHDLTQMPEPDDDTRSALRRFAARATETLKDTKAVEAVLEAAVKRAERHEALYDDAQPLLRLVRSYVRGSYRAADVDDVGVAFAALMYVASPVDAIPDYLPGGLRDDRAVVEWTLSRLEGSLGAYYAWEETLTGNDVSVVPRVIASSPSVSGELVVETIREVDSLLFNRADLPPPHEGPPIAANAAAEALASAGIAAEVGDLVRITGPKHLLAGINAEQLEFIHSQGGNLGIVRDTASKDFAGHLRFETAQDVGRQAKWPDPLRSVRLV